MEEKVKERELTDAEKWNIFKDLGVCAFIERLHGELNEAQTELSAIQQFIINSVAESGEISADILLIRGALDRLKAFTEAVFFESKEIEKLFRE